MADEKLDLESLKQRRSNSQRIFTTRINRLSVSAGRLRELDLTEELKRLKDDYDKLLDASNEYIDALEQINQPGKDSESQDALTKRDANENKFLETENMIMEILWSKYAAPDIDTLVIEFKSALEQAKAFGKDTVVSWSQQGVESGKLDRKLNELSDIVYNWRDYRPHGKDKWMLYLSLKEDREQLVDEWTSRRENERVKRSGIEHGDDGCSGGDEKERDEDVEGDGAASGQVMSANDSLIATDNIAFTKPLTPNIASPSVNTVPAVVASPVDRQGVVNYTDHPPSMSTNGASIITSSPQAATGLNVSFAPPPTLTSTPRPLSIPAPVSLGMGQVSSTSHSGSGTYPGEGDSSQWIRPKIRLTPISLPKFSGDRRDYWRWKVEWESIQAQAEPTGSP